MNERLREELDYCVPLGIPHSAFLSWPELDQDKAIAWLRNQKEICRNCGTRESEWDEKQGGDRFKYVSWAKRCPGCELLDMEREQLPEKAKGMHVFLIPREVGEKLMEDITGWESSEFSPRPNDPIEGSTSGRRGLA